MQKSNKPSKISAFLQPKGPSVLLIYYQEEPPEQPPEQTVKGTRPSPPKQLVSSALLPKKKSLIYCENGNFKLLTGVAIYFIKPKIPRPITEENYNREIMCGKVSAAKPGLLPLTISKTLELIYIPMVMSLINCCGEEVDLPSSVRSSLHCRLIPCLRSLSSSLRTLSSVSTLCSTLVSSPQLPPHFLKSSPHSSETESGTKLREVEEWVREWVDLVGNVVAESGRVRQEGDNEGPQAEVEFWRERASVLALAQKKMRSEEMKSIVQALKSVRSPLVSEMKALEPKILFTLVEAKDVSTYIGRVDRISQALYLEDPVKIKKITNSLVETVIMIQNTCMNYKTSERISHLLIKITNQMILRCKDYLTEGGKGTIWSQSRSLMRTKILDCITLNMTYKKSYKKNCEKYKNTRLKDICISKHFVFGKFDGFCERLKKILTVFDLLDNYEQIFKSHVCGLLWDDSVEEKEKEFKGQILNLTSKDYNHLDYRNLEVDRDYAEFVAKTDELKGVLGKMIEMNYMTIWESPQALKFLKRIEEVIVIIPGITTVGDKYERIYKYFENRIKTTRAIFHKKRSKIEPPLGMPPIGGKVMWIRSMVQQLESFTNEFAAHDILRKLPQYKNLVKEYNTFALEAVTYEIKILKRWSSGIKFRTIEAPLKQTILTLDSEYIPIVNLNPIITTFIAEGDCLIKMEIDVPIPVKLLVTKSDHFRNITDKLEMLIERFNTAVKMVSKEIRPFMFPMIIRLAVLFQPALCFINWTSKLFENYYKAFLEAIDEFGLLSFQVQDFYEFQIQETFRRMEEVVLCAEFTNLPWSLHDFIDKNFKCVREGATFLHEKSMEARDLVDELIELCVEATDHIGSDIIEDFKLDKYNQVLSEVLGTPGANPLSFEKTSSNPDNSGSDVYVHTNFSSPPTSARSPSDWTLVHKTFDTPHSLHTLVHTKPSKELKELIRNSTEDVRVHFSKLVFDIVVRVIKTSLNCVKKRFGGVKLYKNVQSTAARGDDSILPDEFDPVFVLDTYLVGSKILIKPTIDQIQEALTLVGRSIVSSAKGIAQWLSYAPPPNESETQGQSSHQAQIRTLNDDIEIQVYKRLAEDRAGPKYQPYNYYPQVCESKEISKFTSALANSTQVLKESFLEFMKVWKKYEFLWDPDRKSLIKKFVATNPSWVEYEDQLEISQEREMELMGLPDHFDFGAIRIISEKLKNSLLSENRELMVRFGVALKNKYKREMETTLLTISDFQTRFDTKIQDIDDVRSAMESLQKWREIEVDLEFRIPPIEEAFYVVSKYNIPTAGEEVEEADSLSYLYRKLKYSASSMSETIHRLHPTFQLQLAQNLESFREECLVFTSSYMEEGPMVTGLTPREASDKLAYFQNRFDVLWRRNAQLGSGQELFGMAPQENTELSSIKKELNLLQKLYRLYNDVIDRVSSYYDILWKEVKIEEINNELLEFQNRCRKLPKGLKEWPAFYALKKTIDDFNDICPLLELMSNKSMKPRHWSKIMSVCSHEFDLENDTLSLKDILDAPLLEFKEDIEDVCISALKERDIEAKLKQVTTEWSANELIFVVFKNRGELLLRGDTTAETISALEDSLMILGSLLSNRYNAPFKKNIQKWVTDLSNTNEILERWLLVQNMWVYLEAVFVGGDIARQLPKEAKRFSKIDSSWQKIMQRAHETPSVVSCAVGDEMLRTLLPHLQRELEVCQKSLSGYLEKKRLLFPRFFFVSDPALLEILGQASDSHTIQSHLLSIFDNTHSVKFHETDYNKILAINSCEGETIKLERPVKTEGSVEIWLNQLLNVSRQSLHSIIREGFLAISEPDFNMIELLENLPAQVGILALQMVWTRESENGLIQAKHDKKAMSVINNRFLDMLNTLIDQTTRNLTKIERIKFETFITIHVHQRDIFDGLCRMCVKSLADFEWTKQCRSYFRDDSNITEIYITDVYFVYQNEYLGCTERLVITPLTDRCYITLAQALGLSMGGCSAGPAGTGKTETVKDMGKTLGKYVVVFNCSDQMDYKGLGRIYKGLAQSGSWGCFDEFNRIDLPVLSVAAQQIAVVLGCRKERKKQFMFTDGDIIEINPEFGIFLTMNPGYAGRQELPENLKIQFRTVAMYTLYKLCEEQLTKQVHYDFGLRNILSVLRTLGTTKRANAKDAESVIVMRVLRDMNLSKLIDEDEPLFMSLIMDLFPNVVFEKTAHQELEDAIRTQVEAQGLIYHDSWILKLVQLYETQQVRHGIMTLGPSGAGKTTCIHSLMKALTALGTPHKELRMNPKAITAHQMFGRLDVATNDWTDGIFSALWRKTLKAKKGQGDHIWLVLDGPVDSIWIENLNSVLDDNKTLTLANGDRLPMSPTCKVIFEPHNIDNASPATVSRNGMVYMSSSGLNWSPIFEAWLKTRNSRVETVLKNWIETSFFKIYDWARQNLVFKMPILESNIVFQMITLMEGLLPKQEDTPEDFLRNTLSTSTDQKISESEIVKMYVFSLVWSIGAYLETEDRFKFDNFLRDFQPLFPLPQKDESLDGSPENTVFDFIMEDDRWVNWKNRIEIYVFPENYINEFSSILVPNIDTVRTNFLITTVAKQNKSVLLIGEQGSAKTLMIDAYTKNYNADTELVRTMNFSFATTPYQFQKTIESYLEKRVGSTFGPTGGKKLSLFIDDINLPEVSEWGDQVTNEIVRQMIEMKGFYSLEKPGDFIHIVDVLVIGAMIHPGAGRNDIPSRLKRHFCVFNCTLPTDESIDKVFSTIAMGHYNAKRGFTEEVRNLLEKLIGVTRLLWKSTRRELKPSPSKFHYIFNLRDLSRIFQGMIGTLSNVIDSESPLLQLWLHETVRVLTDRFIDTKDREWFDGEVDAIVERELGEKYRKMMRRGTLFVDFMRDAPEPTGEEGEDADVELPKVYEPVEDLEVLKERLLMFLTQYNEIVRGSPMNLVFFPDAMINLVKISRVIRNPGGNCLLVGVGGSGKQSLTKLSSFIAGYKTYQISLTRSYNLSNFLEDIKILYRTCGAQGKGTTFIFSDQDIKEEVFLEYLNNVLSSGLICNLFNRDEHAEIITELTPLMRRELPKKSPTPESVFNFFISRMKQNLHVVLCFSPVGEKFRTRALKFPSLISGSTMNWFSPWPKDALISVAEHFLTDYGMECEEKTKANVILVLGSIQDSVSRVCDEYFQRLRRSAHVTPKSYLNFLSSYKLLYSSKLSLIRDSASRMELGLLKLREAAESVSVLRESLSEMEAELLISTQEAGRVLANVKERAEEAGIIRNRVQESKERAQGLVEDIQKDRLLAEEKLEAAKPALEEAEAALNTIQPAHIATVRKLGRPPHLIMRIMDCVLILFQKKLHWTFPDPQLPCPKPSWAEALKMMSSTNFLVQLQNFPKDTINDEVIDLLEPYFRMEDYEMENAKRVCGDVAGLLSWTRAMAVFHGVNKEVLPLKANLSLQEVRLRAGVNELSRLEEELKEKEEELSGVEGEYSEALSKTEALEGAASTCRRKMSTAMALIEGLSEENKRWKEQSKELKEIMSRLVGDILTATSFLAYSGPFNQEYRAILFKLTNQLVVDYKIPHTKGLSIQSILVESSEVSEWTLQGLPNDELSIENAMIVTNGSSFPLLVDPQTQGKAWIKAKEAKNNLMVTSLNHKYFRTHLEDSLSLGRPLLIEDVDEELDPVIDNVLEKNFIKSGSIEKVVVGDKECDVIKGFMLYITTKLPNPFYTPEISAKTSIIDFTVTMKGLEDQLLGRVILMEKSELEAERMALFESVMQNKRSMKNLEDSLLYKLSTSQGSLVDDEDLIKVLRETKTTSEEVKTKLLVSEETERKITLARDEFRPIASRGSVLYFLVVEMTKINSMYQTSLKQFLHLFDSSIKLSPRGGGTEERILNVLNRINWEIWQFVQRALFEKDRFLFTLLMTLKIHLHERKITHDEFMVLIKGGASLDLTTVQPKPFRWISDITWLNLVELSKLEPFKNVLNEVVSKEEDWKEWEELNTPELYPVPSGYEDILDSFRKLLIVRSFCPDRTLSQAKIYVIASLGPEFGESRILDFESLWSESDESTPLICLLSTGSDPTNEIEGLSKSKSVPLKIVSMGQGQEAYAKNIIRDAMKGGGWTLLQNCHLCLPFCEEMNEIIGSGGQNPSFRLWLTTECHRGFPISLLQAGIKYTNEAPQGIRASMKRTYQNITQDYLDYTGSKHFSPLLFSVAFLHTIVQERRKFGPLGWNVLYEFNKADFTASVQFIQNHLEELNPRKQIISWPTVCYMLGEVQYGGRVTDDFDKRLLNTFTSSWFNESLLHGHFEFYKGYRAPTTKNLIVINDLISNLPIRDSPEVFGLHSNADITYQINSVKSIFEAILAVQPKESSGGSGESRESVVYSLADEMLKKLPLPYVAFEVKDALNKLGSFLPMNIFLRQELDRMGIVLICVRDTLTDLKLAIEGTIIMSNVLRESLDAMYDARVPPSWKRISWDSGSIGFWFTELLERYVQFKNWLATGKPKTFWMTGFFNPQGFLTAMRQEVTRAHKGWALDSVVLQNVVTRFWKEDIFEAPYEGVYVHGLFVEGAAVERRSGKLVESHPKVLYEPVPVVFIFAVNTTMGKDPRLYECPIYRKPRRSDLNYIGSIDFLTDTSPKHWVMRGVALLCDIK